jgi:hypothetical protein
MVSKPNLKLVVMLVASRDKLWLALILGEKGATSINGYPLCAVPTDRVCVRNTTKKRIMIINNPSNFRYGTKGVGVDASCRIPVNGSYSSMTSAGKQLASQLASKPYNHGFKAFESANHWWSVPVPLVVLQTLEGRTEE